MGAGHGILASVIPDNVKTSNWQPPPPGLSSESVMPEPRRSSRLKGKPLEAVTESSKVTKGKKSEPKASESKPKPKAVAAAATRAKAQPAVGDEFPAGIKLLDQEGEDVDLSEVVQSGVTVIFAYPRASTPGCTRQACGFRDLYPKFKGEDVAVFGLSADSVKAQKTFQTKQNLPYKLLSDPKYELIGKLGAKKTATGGIVRSHWIIKDGKFLVVKVGVKPEDSFNGALKEVEK